MECVTIAGFTLNVNGQRIGYFKGGRGLRQVMCHEDVNSVRVIRRALDEFSECSGLLPNNSKSIIFFGSLNDEEKQAILNVLPFADGKLPVKYLGVPLIAKRLSVKDYGSLLDKIKTTKKDTLWVKWVHSVKLRGKNIWEISADTNDSWGWKNLLQIKDLIKDNVRWSDEWYEKFPMITQLELPNLNIDAKDKFVWRNRNGQQKDFSVGIANADVTPPKYDTQRNTTFEVLLHNTYTRVQVSVQMIR
ncbi:hypothetical protein Tco_0768121 [Tanacetum coccineum]